MKFEGVPIGAFGRTKMITLKVAAGGALVLALSISTSYAGPCSNAIDATQLRQKPQPDRLQKRV
jgi:hypothetical protein